MSFGDAALCRITGVDRVESVVCSHHLGGSWTRKLHHEAIVKPVFRNPLPTRRFPTRFS